MPRLLVMLSTEEWTALLELAEAQLRPPSEQVHYLTRTELVRRRLLRPDGTAQSGWPNGESDNHEE